jgi:signal transduction histidine kinase
MVLAAGETERVVVEAVERQHIRLGLDLHDGPLQQVALLAAEVKHLRNQLPELVEQGDPGRAIGRVQDLEAVILGLDRDLREIARAQMPDVDERRFDETLEATTELFANRTRIPVEFELHGDIGEATRSQRIALLRIVQEALANIREHSGAASAQVIVSSEPDGMVLRVIDNGHGFDVARAIERARRAGRFGLAGMSARVLLLGGTLDIKSGAGGPTRITARIPYWRPAGH